MKIGIDGSCLSNRRGFGRFARQLLNAVAAESTHHDFTVFIDGPSAQSVDVPQQFDRVIVEVGQAPSRAASAQGRRRWRDMISMAMAVARARVDLMFFPATYSFFPAWNVPRLVVTVHDTLPLTHPELVFPTAAGALAWRLKEGLATRWADRIITVSEASRQAIESWAGVPDPRIRVITEGPDAVFQPRADESGADAILERYQISRDASYLLYVGGLSPHKNLIRLIEAFARGALSDTILVLTGDFHDSFYTHVPQIREAIKALDAENRILLTGFVPDQDLVFLYSRAYALVLPSLMEGFGLPAVEAMACGIPVIASRAGSLPEVVGDAGVFFDPTDSDNMASVIRAFLCDHARRNECAQLGLERASQFTWQKSARALIACFDELDDNLQRPQIMAAGA